MIKLDDYVRTNKSVTKILKTVSISDDLKAVKYSVGKNGETFAFIAYPQGKMPDGGYPAVLLIHGGEGKAFSEWAKLWAKRGYVAIAPDFCAQEEFSGETVFNEKGGPKGYGSVNDFKSDEPWAYYSVLSAVSALDILSEMQCVNSEKICVQGISWGGFLSLTVCGTDSRPRALSVVYSSAFISDSVWGKERGIKNFTDEELLFYNENIDPQAYIGNIKCPVIFSAGCNDTAFSMKNRMRTAKSIVTRKAYSLRLFYQHSHTDGWTPEEPTVFFGSILDHVSFLEVRFILKDKEIKILNGKEFSELSLIFTKESLMQNDVCQWSERKIKNRIRLPENTLSWFIVGETYENLVVSTEVFDVK